MMFQKFRNSFFLILIFLLNPLTLNASSLPEGYPKCYNSDISKKNYCPLNAKLGHKIFLVDFTSRWEQPQIDWVKGRIFGEGLIADTPPYHKISYLKIDNKPPHSQKFFYSKCRFKKGNKSQKFPGEAVSKKCEGVDVVKSIFEKWNKQMKSVEEGFFENVDADQSLIYEYIVHLLRESSADFGNEYKTRELVIVSDLMQYSKRVNFFKHCKSAKMKLKPKDQQKADKCQSFEKLMSKEKSFAQYLNSTKPNSDMVKNLKVKVLFINHAYEHEQDLYVTLEKLWKDMFAYMGINNVEIIGQIDFKP